MMQALIPAVRKPRQVTVCEFESNLFYIVSSRTPRTTQRIPVSNQNKITHQPFEGLYRVCRL